MVVKSDLVKNTIRPIALSVVAVGFGSLLVLIIEVGLNIEVSKNLSSAITFVFAAFAAFYLFPRVLRLPFDKVSLSEYLHLLGFYIPTGTWKHVFLGFLLAVFTISGMLIGSLLSGRYSFDLSTVSLSQTLFSVNPGIWEEFFYRGIIMILLIRATRSLRKAALIQIALFGFAHIKALDFWAWVDVISVMFMAVVFTYAAFKTRTLVAGIIFHFLHDTFLFLPQLPGGEYFGFRENIAFFVSLWLMLGLSCALIKFSTDHLGVKADDPLYTLDYLVDPQS